MNKLWTIGSLMALSLLQAEASAIDGNLQILENRAAYYGGYSLYLNLETNCPAGTFSCFYTTGSLRGGPCCPTHTFCSDDGVICCPTDVDCTDTVGEAAPTCADPSWTLLSNEDVDVVCCLPGMVASTGGECVEPNATGVATYYTSETQGNNAKPTGDATGAGSSATDSAAAAASTTPAGATPTAGTTATTGGSGSSATAGTTASTTKKSSADKTFVVGDAFIYLMGAVLLFL